MNIIEQHVNNRAEQVTRVAAAIRETSKRRYSRMPQMYLTREQLDALQSVRRDIEYDTALPQSVFDDILDVTKVNPCGHVVYLYQRGGLYMGGLFPVTAEGARILNLYYTGRADGQ